MSLFTGSTGHDTIVATTAAGFQPGDTVDGLGGNDTVTLSPGITYITGPGEDTITGGGFAYWPVNTHVTVNLAEGWAQDGFGSIDHVSGITELHLPAAGADVTGSDAAETVFCFGGSGTLAMGPGQDVVRMWQLDSSQYSIRQVANTVVLTSATSRIELRDVERLEFADRTIDTTFHDRPYFDFQYDIRSFTESQWSQPWTYAGVTYPAQLVSYFAQAVSPFDIGADGDPDLIVPLNRGYRTGVDTRHPFQVLENVGGKLVYNEALTEASPFIAGSRRTDTIFINRYGKEAMVTAAHDTAIETETRTDIPWRFGDLSISLASPLHNIASELVAPATLPRAVVTGRATAIDAHSMAVGDFNGDAMEDILVGDFSGSFVLLQTTSGYFSYRTNDFLHALSDWREPTIANSQPALLLDLHMADLNGDGFDDIVAGWDGHHAAVRSRVFFNDAQGNFAVARSNLLPVSIYGDSNTLHMKTFSADFDKDGDLDLLILNSRSDPYYGGNYLQFLENDGRGTFTDATTARLGDPAAFPDTYSERLRWTDFWQVLDVNGDGALDIAGHRVTGPANTPLIYLNDGTGHFALSQPALDGAQPISWGDFDGDGRIEAVTWHSTWTDAQGTSSINTISDYELKTPDAAVGRAFDIGGNAGFVAKTLAAVFGPAAVGNRSLAGIGLQFADSGLSRDALTDMALDAALPQRTDDLVVRLLYANVTGMQPDLATVNQFVSLISSGQYTQVSLAEMAANHELIASKIDLVGLARHGLEYVSISP